MKEINPSIKRCLQNGKKLIAIKVYYARHPEIGLKEAMEAIGVMEAKMKNKRI